MNIIFSDGSHKKVKDRKIEAVTGAGTIIRTLSDKKEKEKKVSLPDSTINYAELTGIYEGIKYLEKKELIDKEPLVIVTDSKYCITVITDSMILAGKKGMKATWKNKDGTKMKNQELIKKIYEILTDENGSLLANVKFVHVNSHLDERNSDDVERIIHKFKTVGIPIDKESAKAVIKLNNRVDVLANEAADELLSNF